MASQSAAPPGPVGPVLTSRALLDLRGRGETRLGQVRLDGRAEGRVLEGRVARELGHPEMKATKEGEKKISSRDIPNSMAVLFFADRTTPQPSQNLMEPWWNPGGTLMEPSWNLPSGPPRTSPEPIWAETPELSAVGEKKDGGGLKKVEGLTGKKVRKEKKRRMGTTGEEGQKGGS